MPSTPAPLQTLTVSVMGARGPKGDPGYTPTGAGDWQTVTFAASLTINFQLRSRAWVILTGNTTLAFSTADNQSFVIGARQDSLGGRTITWPAGIKWLGGVAPTQDTTPNAVSFYSFTRKGAEIFGSSIGPFI